MEHPGDERVSREVGAARRFSLALYPKKLQNQLQLEQVIE